MSDQKVNIQDALDAEQPAAEEQAEGTVTEPEESGTETKPAIDEAQAAKIADARSERATKSALTAYFKEQGMTDAEAKQAFDAFKADRDAKREAQRNDLTALQAENDQLRQDKEAVNARLIRATIMAKAATMQIRPERIKQAVRLANMTGITIGDDGEPDDAAISAALDAVVKEMPELLISKETQQAQGIKVGAPTQDQTASGDQLDEIFGLKRKG